MRVRSSQTRRRRLIQGGLLGDAAAAATPQDMVEHEFADDVGEDSAADLATNAILRSNSHQAERARRTSPTLRVLKESTAHSHAGLAAIQSLIHGKRDVTWVFSGDNVIQGACSTGGLRNCVEIFSERIRAELRRAGDVVINTGIAGESAGRLLASLKRRVLRYRPEVVGLSIGLNDSKRGPAGRASFRRDVCEILDRIRNAGSVPLVILPHPIYLPASPQRADLPQYVEILREEIQRDEVPCIDHWSDWLQHWPDPNDTRSRLFDGRIQLNAAGHQHLAALIFRVLKIYDPESCACRGPVVD